MRLALLLLTILIRVQLALGQSYWVEVPEPFRTPEYLAMDPSPDQCGFTAMFWDELKRAGYSVVTIAQAEGLRIRPHEEVSDQEVLVEIHRILSTALKVDPTILPMKRNQLLRYLRESGVREGTDGALEAGIRQGVLVSLPGMMLALNPDALPPELPEVTEAPWTPPQIYRFTFNYTYRPSMRCGSTATELRAAINDWDTGKTMCSIRFEQTQLAGRCPSDIAYELVRRVKNAAHYDLDVNLGPTSLSANTILTIGEGSGDCEGASGKTWTARLGAELMSRYTLVDRGEMDHLMQEQYQDMANGAFADSDFIEAGKLLGAEAMLFGEVQCRLGKTVADVKLISTSTGAALWTAHGENASPAKMAEYVLHELSALED